MGPLTEYPPRGMSHVQKFNWLNDHPEVFPGGILPQFITAGEAADILCACVPADFGAYITRIKRSQFFYDYDATSPDPQIQVDMIYCLAQELSRAGIDLSKGAISSWAGRLSERLGGAAAANMYHAIALRELPKKLNAGAKAHGKASYFEWFVPN